MRRHLGEIPQGFEIRHQFAQTKVLPTVDAFVTHGGLGSITEALYFDRPLLILPQAVDQHRNADRVVGLGAGLTLSAAQVTPSNLYRALRALVHEPAFADRAREIGLTLRRAGGYRRAADAIERALAGPVTSQEDPGGR